MILSSTFGASVWIKFSVNKNMFLKTTVTFLNVILAHRSFPVFLHYYFTCFDWISDLFHRFRGPFFTLYVQEDCFKMVSQIDARATFSAKIVPKHGVPLLSLSTLELYWMYQDSFCSIIAQCWLTLGVFWFHFGTLGLYHSYFDSILDSMGKNFRWC